jgi:hypothetical protein
MNLTTKANDLIDEILKLKESLLDSENVFEERYGEEIVQGQDYVVAYEARFLPSGTQSLKLEFWVTPDGQCAVGVGRFGDLASRIGVSCYSRERFIGGNEPKPLTAFDVSWIFGAVRCGNLKVTFLKLPALGLLSAHICLSQGQYKSKPAVFDWIKSCPRFGKCLCFDPWK